MYFAKSYLVEQFTQVQEDWRMRKNAAIRKVVRTNLRRLRKTKGLTQEDLAFKIGVSRAYIGYIEQGSNIPSLDTLEKLAKALDVSITALVG